MRAIKISLVLMLIGQATTQSQVCYGENCQLECHCVNDDVCDRETGYCANGCASLPPDGSGWDEPICQRGNIAYKKSTRQSSYAKPTSLHRGNFSTSDYAVDGIIQSNPNVWPCIYTNSGLDDLAWWMVDLEALHVIETATVYNRIGASLVNFNILVGNTSAITDQVYCYASSAVARGGSLKLSCYVFLIGRYVSVQLNTPGQVLGFCEIVIIGYKFIVCPPGIQTQLGCTLPCIDKQFGLWCEGRCLCKDENEVCDKVTGSCPLSGCSLWQTADNCSVYIISPGAVQNISILHMNTAKTTIVLQWRPNRNVAEFADIYPQFYYYIVNLTLDFQVQTYNISHVKTPYLQLLIDDWQDDQVENVLIESYRVNEGISQLGVRTTYSISHAVCPSGIPTSTGCTCPDKHFGISCEGQCQCKDENEVCDKLTGSCPRSGCPLWKTAANCSVDIIRPGIAEDMKVVHDTPLSVTIQWSQNKNITEFSDAYPQHYSYMVNLLVDGQAKTFNVPHARRPYQQLTIDQLQPGKTYFVFIESYRVQDNIRKLGARTLYLSFNTGSSNTPTTTTTTPRDGVLSDACRNLTASEAPDDGYLLCVELVSQRGIFCEFLCYNPATELVPDTQSYIHCGPNTNNLWSFQLDSTPYTFPSCVLKLNIPGLFFPATTNICDQPASPELIGAFVKVLVEDNVCSSVSSCLVVTSKIVCGQITASAGSQ